MSASVTAILLWQIPVRPASNRGTFLALEAALLLPPSCCRLSRHNSRTARIVSSAANPPTGPASAITVRMSADTL